MKRRRSMCGIPRARCGLACDDRRSEFFRSEEHTSELQSLMRHSYAVFCWKKKKEQTKTPLSPPNDNKKHKKKHIPHIHTTHNIKHEQTQIVITHQLYSNTHNHHT